MLYVECRICRDFLRTVVSRFRLVESDVEPVKVVKVGFSKYSKFYTLSKFDNIPTVGCIIPPSLRNNGLHCVFVQVRKLIGDFISRVPFSLCEDLSSFSNLKQGNGVHPCMVYASSCNDVAKKRFLNIWMDVFGFCYLQVVMFQQWCMVWSK